MAVYKKYKENKPTYKVEAFDGGKNTKFSDVQIDDRESPDCQNITFDDVGAVGTRLGSAKLNTASVGSHNCNGLFSTNWSDGNKTMVAFFGDTAYTLETTTFATIGSAQSVFTDANRVQGCQYYEVAFFGNGGVTPYKYNGTEWTRHGVPAPASSPTEATNSNGTLVGDYQYKVTWVNSYSVEGDVSTASDTFTATNEDIVLTLPDSPPTSYGVENAYIYRTKDAGSVFYYLDTVTATVSSYTDNTDDADLSATEAPTDAGEPPNYVKAVAHQDRLWMFEKDSQQLWYSESLNPFNVASTNYLYVNRGDGEEIKDIGVIGNSIAIIKENSVWYLYLPDSTPSNWQLIKAIGSVGGVGFNCTSPFQYRGQDSGLIFMGKQGNVLSGFHILTGEGISGDVLPTYASTSSSERIEPDIEDFDTTNIIGMACIQYDEKVYFAVPLKVDGAAQSTNNRIYVFDPARRAPKGSIGAWVPYKGLNASCFVVHDGDLYYGSAAADGFVYQMEKAATYNDDGSAIDSYYWTKMFRGPKEIERNWKNFRRAYLWVDTPGDYNMNMSVKRLGDSGSGSTKEINLNPGGSLWGTMLWGDDWGGGMDDEQKRVSIGQLGGEGVQFKFDNQNTADQRFKVYWLEFDFNLRSPRG